MEHSITLPASDPGTDIDLIGGPFAVIESDPGLFTSLTRNLGIRGLEVVELYDIEPWAVDHINPKGLIFCFFWHKDSHRPFDFDDPAAGRIWFANQLIDDACASQAILNIVLNCPDVEIGEDLRRFRKETEKMSATMKGLAISNSRLVRQAHNALARPADLRGATYSVVKATIYSNTRKVKARRKAKTSTTSEKKEIQKSTSDTTEEVYHFIGYVPAHGKVWELDGLKSGPLEVGELVHDMSSQMDGISDTKGWMEIVRPALRMKMKKYGGSSRGNNIRFSLLALVHDQYQTASDDLELLRREKRTLERRLDEVNPNIWRTKVDPDIAALAVNGSTVQRPPTTFAADFGTRGLQQDLEILDMPERNLVHAWQECLKNTIPMQVRVEDEIMKSIRARTDHVKRTYDYEPFIQQFIVRLQNEGLLRPLLDEGGFNNKLVTKMPKVGRKENKPHGEHSTANSNHVSEHPFNS